MTTTRALMLAQRETIELLKSAGCVDGEKATDAQRRSTQVVLFWDSVLKSKAASDKQTYVVYSVVSAEPVHRADDGVITREAYVNVDVFARRSMLAKSTQDLISALNAAALSAGWAFESGGATYYEPDTAIYHSTFGLTKAIYD